jgi:hypothetical protein
MNNQKLIYPSVNLFLYDLRDSLGQDLEIKRNRVKFWRKIDLELDKQIKELVTVNQLEGEKEAKLAVIDSPLEKKLKELETKENPEADYVILDQKLFKDWVPASNFDGFCLAAELGDTYSLIVNCSGSYLEAETKKPNNNSQSIEAVAANKQTIVANINHRPHLENLETEKQGSIGQSWFVWGQLSDSNSNPREVAEECYQQLNLNASKKPKFKELGEFNGSIVFEYWQNTTNWGQKWDEFVRNSNHAIICLFPPGLNPETIDINRQKMQNIYFDLARLFCYRHKAIWAYWQSRKLKEELKRESREIKNLVDKVKAIAQQIQEKKPLKLAELQLILTQVLPLVSSYADRLFLLENQGKTIAVNLESYGRRLAAMEQKTNSNLEGWKEFKNFAKEKYQQQIESDSLNLSPELKVLENLVSTVRGIIDIEQAKGDRDLSETVAVVGTALTVSAVIATVAVGGDSPPQSYLDLSFMKSPAFVLSLLPVAIALLILLWRRWRS